MLVCHSCLRFSGSPKKRVVFRVDLVAASVGYDDEDGGFISREAFDHREGVCINLRCSLHWYLLARELSSINLVKPFCRRISRWNVVFLLRPYDAGVLAGTEIESAFQGIIKLYAVLY